MKFPQSMTRGFNFNEAIAMAELSRRVYRVFEFERDREIGELYNAIYNDEWEFVHSMSDYETDGRALILKRKEKNQFALVFRGTIVTSGGFEFTGMEDNRDVRLVEYQAIAGEPMPPSRDVRVYEAMQEGFEALRDELELFFGVLVGCKLEQKALVDLINADQEERASRIAAIGAAIGLKYGPDTQEQAVKNISCVLDDIRYGKINPSNMSFNDLINHDCLIEEGDELRLENKTSYSESDKLEVYVTGHSRGGALATFAVLHLKRYSESKACFPPVSLKMYNVGSTKVGNKAFVNYYNGQMNGFSYRVQNLLDSAIYYPTACVVPFPYNLQLMIPGIDYVRQGDLYYAHYEHVGEAYTVVGLGHQKLNLNFGGPLNFTIPLPFPHGPDGYKKMLIEAHERQEKALMTFETYFSVAIEKQREAFHSLESQLSEIQKTIDKLQKQEEPSKDKPAPKKEAAA